MSTKAKRHIHKYHQVDIAGTPVWACARPDCNHYMPAHMTAMVLGKNSICWLCEEPIILDKMNMLDAQPICMGCKHKSSKLAEFLESQGVK